MNKIKNKKLYFTSEITTIEKINPLFSKVKIKIAYTNMNQNGSFISKEAFMKALPSIYNCPIIGEFYEESGEFGSHGGKIVIDEKGLKWQHTTKPYGLINESSEISWENVTETNGKSNEYLCATGYLWTGRYDELETVINKSAGQSMEIEIKSGKWAKFDEKDVYEVSEFIFSGFCILGTAKPCFESASIQLYSYSFDEYKDLFNQMVSELRYALNKNQNNDKGGTSVKYTKEQIMEMFQSSIKAQELVKDCWGQDIVQYEYIDNTDVEIFAKDYKNKYNLVAFDYTILDELININYDSVKRYADQDTLFGAGFEVDEFFTYSAEYIDNVVRKINEVNNSIIETKTAEFEAMKTELEMEYATKSDDVTIAHKNEIQKLTDQYTAIEIVYQELSTYKENKIMQETELAENELFEKFSTQLTIEEIETVKLSAKSNNFTIDEMENQLFAILGKKNTKFSKKESKPIAKIIVGDETEIVPKNTKSYAQLIMKHKN